MSDVTIDRLVLDVPGIDPAAVQALAFEVAQTLAASGRSGEVAHLTLTLDPAEAGGPGSLAARIAAALLQAIG